MCPTFFVSKDWKRESSRTTAPAEQSNELQCAYTVLICCFCSCIHDLEHCASSDIRSRICSCSRRISLKSPASLSRISRLVVIPASRRAKLVGTTAYQQPRIFNSGQISRSIQTSTCSLSLLLSSTCCRARIEAGAHRVFRLRLLTRK